MKKNYFNFRILGVLLFCLPMLANAQTLWVEDFDGSNTTNPIMSPNICSPFSDDRDYFNIVCIDGAGCPNEINDDFFYFGSTGQFFGARDIDSSPCNSAPAGTFSFQGIDISSCSDVPHLCFTVAESRNIDDVIQNEYTGSGGGREDTWDGDSGVTISASIDGAFFTPVTAFSNTTGPQGGSSRSDGRPGIDLDCSGFYDPAAGEVELTATFTQYCFQLPSRGAALDLQVSLQGLNAGGEDIGIDNLEVVCGTPASGTVLPSCTPFTAITPTPPGAFKFFENFDGSNTSNPISYPTGCNHRDDSRDYFVITCLDGGCSNDMNGDYTYIGAEGMFFGVRDMDEPSAGCELNETFAFTGIDISSPTGLLYLCVDIAESRPSTNPNPTRELTGGVEDSWDPGSSLTFLASIDGAAEFPIAAFAPVGASNSRPAIDTDCDGVGDGQELQSFFQTFCFEINGAGSTLDLSVNVQNLNTDGEDVAIDNIGVICTEDLAELGGIALSQSCTAPVRAVPTMGEWALFILFLLIANLGALFIMAFQKQPTLATGNQTVSMSGVLRSASFNKEAFGNALKHALGLAIVGFAIIYIGWGEIVAADFIGMAVSIPLVAYFIHLFYTKE